MGAGCCRCASPHTDDGTTSKANPSAGSTAKVAAKRCEGKAAPEVTITDTGLAAKAEAENSDRGYPDDSVDGVEALEDMEAPEMTNVAKASATASTDGAGAPRRFPSNISNASQKALQTLEEIDRRLRNIEKRVSELDDALRGPPEKLLDGVGKIKTELAALEAEANRLESAGVDTVYTSELKSGKLSAKDTKRDQLARFEVLFNNIEELFNTIKVLQKRPPTAA